MLGDGPELTAVTTAQCVVSGEELDGSIRDFT